MIRRSRRSCHWLPAPACWPLLLMAACINRSSDFQGEIADRCETSRDCRYELHCQEQTGTCQVDLEEEVDGLGTECTTNNDCPGSLLCQPETLTCQVIEGGGGIPGPVLLGGACAADEDCDQGLVCQFASETCQPPGDDDLEGLGASCVTNGDCSGDLVCQDASGTCQPAPPADGD